MAFESCLEIDEKAELRHRLLYSVYFGENEKHQAIFKKQYTSVQAFQIKILIPPYNFVKRNVSKCFLIEIS